jgi:DNA (cytosine-5)-methyltransferase 1
VLLENVPFMLQLEQGKSLDRIVSEFEARGYAWAYRVVDSRAFGLPQRRRRVFLLASQVGDPRTVLLVDDAGEDLRSVDPTEVACGFYWTEGNRGIGWAVDAVPTLKGGSTLGIPSPPAIIMPRGQVIKPDIRDAERLQGFPSNWTRAAERIGRARFRWKLVGNAVSVPVARWIGRRLRRPSRYEGAWDSMLQAGSRWPSAAWNDGSGRRRAEVSEWPARLARRPLHEFLRYPGEPLSLKASAGFLLRVESPLNRLQPPERLLSTLRAHRERMLSHAATKTSPTLG